MLASSSFCFRHFQSKLPLQITLFSMQDGAEKEFCLALDDITKLIDTGKEKGHLTSNGVNDLIPHNVHSPEDLDDLLTTIGTRGIDVLEGQPELPSSALEKNFDEEVEADELDLTPDALENTNDPVRIYLREMGIVPCSLANRKWTLPGASSADN